MPVRSPDGRVWTAGRRMPRVARGSAVALSGGGRGRLLHAAFAGDPENGVPNAVLRSADGGLTWAAMPLPDWAGGWGSIADLAVSPDDPRAMAVALELVVPGEAPVPPRVLLTRDGGARWDTLAAGAPRERYVELGGLTADGEVAALFHDQPAEGQKRGSVLLWRRLTVAERLRRSGGLVP